MVTFWISLLIFALRVIENGIGTIRIVMLVRERSIVASVLGFFQALVFVLAAGIVFENLESIPRIIGFSLGFAVGTGVGSWIEQRLALGNSILRIVTPVGSPPVEDVLRDEGYGVTVLNAKGMRGDVKLAWTVVPRKRLRHVLGKVDDVNEDAYVTVQSVTTVDVADRRRRVRS